MGYDLHIERTRKRPDSEPTPISIESGVRQSPRLKVSAYSPATFMEFSIRRPASMSAFVRTMGDAEVLVPDEEQWCWVFAWVGASAKFTARGCTRGDTQDPVWASAVALASRLGALIRGDEGEIYDLRTGAIIGSVGSA